jgi:hypothetical protein
MQLSSRRFFHLSILGDEYDLKGGELQGFARQLSNGPDRCVPVRSDTPGSSGRSPFPPTSSSSSWSSPVAVAVAFYCFPSISPLHRSIYPSIVTLNGSSTNIPICNATLAPPPRFGSASSHLLLLKFSPYSLKSSHPLPYYLSNYLWLGNC